MTWLSALKASRQALIFRVDLGVHETLWNVVVARKSREIKLWVDEQQKVGLLEDCLERVANR